MEQKPWCFCDRDTFEDRIFKEDEFFYFIFDYVPVSPGHTLIAPKKHIVSMLDMDVKMWIKLHEDIAQAIKIIETTDLKMVYQNMLARKLGENTEWFLQRAIDHPRINTKPDGYNHGINEGRAAGRTVDHLHWHIIPRYDGDMADPRGGVRHVIPEMGNYKTAR